MSRNACDLYGPNCWWHPYDKSNNQTLWNKSIETFLCRDVTCSIYTDKCVWAWLMCIKFPNTAKYMGVSGEQREICFETNDTIAWTTSDWAVTVIVVFIYCGNNANSRDIISFESTWLVDDSGFLRNLLRQDRIFIASAYTCLRRSSVRKTYLSLIKLQNNKQLANSHFSKNINYIPYSKQWID